MYDCDVRGMAQRLVEDGVIPAGNEERAYDALKGWWEGKIALLWCRDDVRGAIDPEGEEEIDDETCDEILSRVLRHHDCERGVSWQTIGDWAGIVMEE